MSVKDQHIGSLTLLILGTKFELFIFFMWLSSNPKFFIFVCFSRKDPNETFSTCN